MALALFDLDHTLIAGDSDQLWGDYLAEQGLVGADYQARKHGFYADYCAGRLDYPAFARFVLEPLARLPMAELLQLRAGYARDKLRPMLLSKGLARIAAHREAGDTVVIITATNRFIAEPAAALCGVAELLATEPERADGRFTGGYRGEPCFQAGKLAHLRRWLARQEPFGTGRDAALPRTNGVLAAKLGAPKLGSDPFSSSSENSRRPREGGDPVGGNSNRLDARLRGHDGLGEKSGSDPFFSLAAACFYSDSHNDRPLLDAVGRPIAVDPDPRLRAHALAQGWDILSFREG